MSDTYSQTEITAAATCHVACLGMEPTSTGVDFATMHRQLADVGNASSQDEMIQRLAPLLATISARFVVLCDEAPCVETPASIDILYGEDADLSVWKKAILGVARRVVEDKASQVVEEAVGDSFRLVALSQPSQAAWCLVAAFDQGVSISQAALFTLRTAVLQIAAWRVRQEGERREKAARRLAILSELVSRLETARSLDEASHRLANELREYLGCQQVVVGLCRNGSSSCRVRAISNVDAFHPNSEKARVAQAALQESIARGDLSLWPPRDESGRFGLKALERFATSVAAEVVVGSALRDERDTIRGAWLFAGSASDLHQDDVLRLLRAARSPVASTLGLLERCQSGWIGNLSGGLAKLVRRRRGQAILAALALAVAMLFIPVPHRLKCDCQLEPVTRRFVAAPFDGPLKETFVEPGDFVTRGQLLARMDGREVRWELSGVQADLFRATKERAGHVAAHEAGAAVVAGHEVDRLQYREQLLRARDQELEIRSPVDGIVVSGDLKEAEGMPLKVGEVLFEVAPLDAMVVELAVPEDDFPYLRSGTPVRIKFDAFPLRPYQAEVERVHPRAELRDEQNVFIAEVRLDNPRQALHPGMHGHARLDVGKGRLGWILFRRPAAAALELLGW